MKVKALLRTGLTMCQAGKLFGIAKDELDLKSGFVIAIEYLGIQVGVSGE